MNTGDKVTILTGRAKTGKTHEILRRISGNERQYKKSLLIVPSGLSFETEKRLAAACGGGFMHTTLTGFFRLGERVLEDCGQKASFINSQGRVMLIRRAIEKAKKNHELDIFRDAASKPGFAVMCNDIFSNFISCELTPDEISQSADKLEKGSFLQRKMADLAVIYRGMYDCLEETGQAEATEDGTNRKRQIIHAESGQICSCIPNSDICKVNIYIDGIENPGKQIYEMIRAMLPVAESMTISLLCDTTKDAPRCFTRESEILERLRSLIKTAGYVPHVVNLSRDNRYSDEVFEFIEKRLWAYPPEEYTRDSSKVKLISASGLKAEIDMLIACIKDLIKHDVRYREMAIIAADPATYDSLIKTRFAQMNLPLFTDKRINLFSTAPAVLVRAALACVYSDYRTQDLCDLVKTGYAGITADEAEKLENYLITCGICGEDTLRYFGGADDFPEAKDLLKKVFTPLDAMKKRMKRGTVEDRCAALTEYLAAVKLKDAVYETAAELADAGFEVEAKQYEQIYEMIASLLKQLSTVMGQMSIDKEAFSDIIDEGLTADIIGIIPAVTDTIIYSDIRASLPDEVKYVFIIGATEDKFPPVRKDDSIIDDSELASISATGIDVWLNTASKRIQDTENIYKIITHADKLLYISYPVAGKDGKNMPAPIISRLNTMLGREKFMSNYDEDCPYRLYDMDTAARGLRALADNVTLTDTAKSYISAYMRNEESREEFESLISAVYFDPSPAPIGAELIDELYNGKFYGSVSSVETYNECPFAHFMQYSMRAKPRKAYTSDAADDGSFYHEVIERFTRTILDNGTDIHTVTGEETDEILKNAFDTTVTEYRSGLYSAGGMMAAKRRYMYYVLRHAVHAITEHFRTGSFDIMATEVKFGKGCLFPPITIRLDDGREVQLSGKIDRIDSFRDADTVHLRIIDYKLSNPEFSPEKLYAGLQLQLPVYLEAVSGGKYDGCGMYYMTIGSAPSGKNEADLAEKIANEFKLRGLTLSEPEIIIATAGTNEITPTAPIEKKTEIGDKSGIYNLMTREQLNTVRRIATDRVKSTLDAIFSGKIPVSPYRFSDEKTTCRYCDYKGVCMFDETLPACSYRTLEKPDFSELSEKSSDE